MPREKGAEGNASADPQTDQAGSLYGSSSLTSCGRRGVRSVSLVNGPVGGKFYRLRGEISAAVRQEQPYKHSMPPAEPALNACEDEPFVDRPMATPTGEWSPLPGFFWILSRYPLFIVVVERGHRGQEQEAASAIPCRCRSDVS